MKKDVFSLLQDDLEEGDEWDTLSSQMPKIGSGQYRIGKNARESVDAMVQWYEQEYIADEQECIIPERLIIQSPQGSKEDEKVFVEDSQRVGDGPYDEPGRWSREEKRARDKKPKHKKKKEKKKDDSRHINKDKRSPIGPCDIPYAQVPMSGVPRRREKRELDIDSVVKTLKKQHSFICIAGRKLYAFTGRYYEDITDKNNATAVFKDFLSEETNRLIRDYTEIQNQLLSDNDIWYNSMEEIRRDRYVVVFWNGTYDIREQKFYEDRFSKDDYVFSILRFAYQEGDVRGKEFIDDFIDTFCNGDPMRKRLFKEIVGFCISNFENKKACFYFLGVPNSGKSSVCRFLETAVGSDAYISVAVKQLNSRFVSGDLEGIKICADEDVAIRTPLRSEDVSLIKKITSSDKIRTDAKYQKPGQLHPECKLVWAGNGMMTFETSEDLQPLIDRMIIFPLD